MKKSYGKLKAFKSYPTESARLLPSRASTMKVKFLEVWRLHWFQLTTEDISDSPDLQCALSRVFPANQSLKR